MAEHAPLEEARFGVTAARATVSASEGVPAILEWFRRERCALMIIRCDTRDHQAIHAIEAGGGRLCDTLLYYQAALDRETLPGAAGIVRQGSPADAGEVEAIARAAFRGYLGHYHTDPRLDPSKADEAYADWARRSCVVRGLADLVLVAERDGKVAGFLTLRRNSTEEAEIVLNAVHPDAQRGGLYRALVENALAWARKQGARQVVASTQLHNVGPQKTWVRLGFAPTRSLHTFHLWSD
jgi:GNAT superfamily N-acetyltransferase